MSKLYVIGTPIGNLKDITLRAIETLNDVDVIACEDTRVTKKLLNHLEIIGKRTIAYHDKNEKSSAKGIIEMILSGKNVGLVSDAGMPVINDPGYEVIRLAIGSGVEIVVIPSVSAVLTTLVLSNFDTHFTFIGFLKPKSGQRQNQLKKLSPGTYVAFVSPHRIMSELEDIKTVFTENIKLFLGRELTKKFETHYRGTVVDVMEAIKDEIKGEMSIAFEVPKFKKVNKYAK
ncbi:16S rRNA (cytidine(1402)-2'-O)-methyltransferase [Candidatus Mycoplasma mahonii]|uniref:16S rRNA (cytidine(1402)-2'-O)-methyltransferase n=1 Tax=Candidatus Mycoplasma mahonii TaxID=3004105 RepID=UPI0026F379CE|nr:16S rRNA (cytidine(1402)-2'-O)-methyltransferase [Candidatus Mycoplasma mahonii]WKX02609.1 16S rRNA (cytidine(1402)-2'-O)-methyltransferase [Candidatus Mycoplasma mahonii]